MKLSELNKLLKDKNITLKDFEMVYIVPQVEFRDKKEIVRAFDLRFQKKRKPSYEEGNI